MGTAIAQHLGELDFSLESGRQELVMPEQGSGGGWWEAGGLHGSWEPGSKPFVAPQGSIRARLEKEKKGGSSALLLAYRESYCKGFFLHV